MPVGQRGILITLTEVGRPAHCGWHHSLAGTLECIIRERTEQQAVSIVLCLLTVDVMWPAISSSCHLNFFIVMDCSLELWPKINTFFIKFCLTKYFITATGGAGGHTKFASKNLENSHIKSNFHKLLFKMLFLSATVHVHQQWTI